MAKFPLRRIGHVIAKVLLGLLLLIVGLVLLVTLALDLPPVRELVRKQANAQLEKTLMGKVTLERIGHVGFHGVAGVDANVHDPAGKRVVALRGATVDTFWPRIVWSALTDDGFIEIDIEAVHLSHAEVRLLDDGSGGPTLAAAFEPKPSPKAPGPSTEARIFVRLIRVDHAWTHGKLGESPPVDVEISELEAALRSDAKGTSLVLDRTGIVARALPEKVDPRGTLAGRLDLPSQGVPRAKGRYAGTLAGAQAFAEGAWDGSTLRALLRVPDVSKAATERLGLAVSDPTSLRVGVNGKLPDLLFDGELAGEAIHLGLRGKARLDDETRVSATVDAGDVDLSRLIRDAPSSALGAHAEMSVSLAPSGELDGEYRIDVPAGRVEAQSTPHVETRGHLRQSEDGALSVKGQATIDEPGAPIQAVYDASVNRGTTLVHAKLDGKLRNPPRLAALGVRASGTLSASAAFDSTANSLDAQAKLRLDSVQHEAVRAHKVALNATVRGTASDPRIVADVTAGPVDAGGRRFTEVAMTTSGKPSRLNVNALLLGTSPDRVELETEISMTRAIELGGVRVTLFGSEGGPMELRARKVLVADGSVRVERFSLRGAGSAEGDFEMLTGRQHVELSATDLELGRIARLVGVRVPFQRALVSANVSLARQRNTLEGEVRARASDVRVGKLEGASASVALVFTPKDVSGTADADFGEGGRFHVELERFELPREPWTLAKLAGQPGSLVARGDLRLNGFLPVIQASGLPIERIAGTAKFDISASGEDPSGPRIEARIETKGLRVVERRAHQGSIRTIQQARQAEPRALEDVDVKLLLDIEPKERIARLDLELFDPYGTILSLEGDTKLPENWPRTLGASYRTLPLRAKLELPRRPMEIFPTAVRPAAAKGVLSARVELTGSVVDPRLDAELELDGLRVRQDEKPVRVAMSTHYERARGHLSLEAETRGRTVGTLAADWRGDLAKMASVGTDGRSPIVLDLEGELDHFPLDSIPALVDRQIRGPLSGKIRLEGLGRDAKLDVNLDGSKMKIGEIRMERLRAEIGAHAGRVRVHVEGGDRTGNAEVDLETSVVWGDRLVPSVPTRAEARLVARSFRIDTLSPALKQALNEVGGRLDADLRMKLEPGNTVLSGQASVRDGVIQVPAVGQRFTDVTARVHIEGDRVIVRDVSARGPTGRMTARAAARLDGLELVTAEAHVVIAERQKIPVTFEGAAVGDAWGRVAVLYRSKEDANEIRVDLRSLHVELAEEGDLEVQSLDEVESIRIGARLADGTFTSLPVQPLESGGEEGTESGTPMRVRIRLGRDVEIARGQMLKVKLGGEILMTNDGESRVTGRLELRGGKLDVQGKLFDIERGLVTFAGDASNPTITATARWDSPVGYSVYADYSGDVKNGKITLHSEPPLTQDEIASLLMFGDPEGSMGTGSGDTNSAATAVGVAGGTAAKGINRALSDLTRLDVAARVDTSTGTSRPELVVQVSPRVAARVTRAVGEPQAGQPPDRTFFTVDFRLTRSWSVSAVVGDHGGSGMDVIWRRRY
jgi:hypothetical protein